MFYAFNHSVVHQLNHRGQNVHFYCVNQNMLTLCMFWKIVSRDDKENEVPVKTCLCVSSGQRSAVSQLIHSTYLQLSPDVITVEPLSSSLRAIPSFHFFVQRLNRSVLVELIKLFWLANKPTNSMSFDSACECVCVVLEHNSSLYF